METTEEQNQKTKRSIFQIINDNGVLSSIVASVVFTYLITSPERKLVCKTNFHEEILNLESNPDFSLLYKDSLTLKKNLYLVSLSFWNEGKTPIIRNDLRKELTISVDSLNEILGEIEINESHKGIINTGTEINDANNEISVNFDFLERGNQIDLKFYYIGNDSSRIEMDTYITGGSGVGTPSINYRGLFALLISLFLFIAFWAKLSKYLKDIDVDSRINRLKGFPKLIASLIFIILVFGAMIGSLLGILKVVIEIISLLPRL